MYTDLSDLPASGKEAKFSKDCGSPKNASAGGKNIHKTKGSHLDVPLQSPGSHPQLMESESAEGSPPRLASSQEYLEAWDLSSISSLSPVACRGAGMEQVLNHSPGR